MLKNIIQSVALIISVIKLFYDRQSIVSYVNTYALPNETFPLRYDLWIKTDIDKGQFNFSGRVRIRLKVQQATHQISLHYRDIDVSTVTLIEQNSIAVSRKLNFYFDDVKELLHIKLPSKVTSNETILIEINYTGTLRDDLRGFHRLSYMNHDNQTVWLAATHFEATYARNTFPCFDEPAIRAVISLEVEHDDSYHAISNMPVNSRNRISGTSHVITRFEDTPPMQTYLIAFVISDFSYVEVSGGKTPQRIYARSAVIQGGKCDLVAQNLLAIINICEDYFGIPHPMPKLDHVALPQHYAGKHYFML